MQVGTDTVVSDVTVFTFVLIDVVKVLDIDVLVDIFVSNVSRKL